MQRYFALNQENNYLILDINDMHHIKNVMRNKTGDLIEVVYDTCLFICEVNVNNNKVLIKEKIIEKLENKPKITLIISLLKEDKMDYILQKSTELGVDEIIPIITERTIIKLDPKKEEKRLIRWNKICKEAAEQSKRLTIPVVKNVVKLKQLKQLNGLSILGSTITKENNISNLLQKLKNYDKINVIIGPEGGFSETEETFLKTINFIPTSFGKNILRAETAPLFVLSAINYEFME